MWRTGSFGLLLSLALAGPLLEHTRQEVEQQLAECLAELSHSTGQTAARRRPEKARAKA